MRSSCRRSSPSILCCLSDSVCRIRFDCAKNVLFSGQEKRKFSRTRPFLKGDGGVWCQLLHENIFRTSFLGVELCIERLPTSEKSLGIFDPEMCFFQGQQCIFPRQKRIFLGFFLSILWYKKVPLAKVHVSCLSLASRSQFTVQNFQLNLVVLFFF